MWFVKGMLKVIAVGIIGMIALACVGIGIGAWDKHKAEQVAEERNPTALAAGFRDYKDMDQAAKNGFSDSNAWHEAELKKYEEKRKIEHAEFLATHPTERMKISKTTWNSGGSSVVLNVTIKNENDYGVKDIGIGCVFKGNSGTQLDEKRHVIFETIPANTEKVLREVNLGFTNSQASRYNCWIVSARRL